jgi:hypothetical protein
MKKYTAFITLLLIMSSGQELKAQQKGKASMLVTSITKKETVTDGMSITVPLVVAVFALLSSIGSLYMSFRIKDKEYTNDYYKKVIDKRIKAIECAEMLVAMFSTYCDTDSGDDYYQCYFEEDSKGKNLSIMADKTAAVSLWYSKRTDDNINDLITSAFAVAEEGETLKGAEKEAFFASKFVDIEKKKDALAASIANDMYTLYDVEAFFKAKLGSVKGNIPVRPDTDTSKG